ncbi:MAG: hypothetical protein SGBAC_008263 [Bacillariaceae sp.]
MGGQNSEEAAELVATIRGEHVVMKNWYSGSSKEAADLRGKYGPYPGLWKEVLNWPGWKEARKAYLKHTQTKDSASNGNGNNNESQNTVPRKRRSRWGNANDNGGDQASKRRSRWGRDGPAPPPPSRPAMKPLPGLGLPGMPTNLSPQQHAEFANCQTRLREINSRMQNLDREAARVDALPRGHRDRSPSPPPVYGADGKRKNTRAVRWRDRWTAERQDLLEKLMNLNPATRQSGLFRRKRTKKIRIPVEQHPQYNFIGLIIGPRGKTQKELESKTGCKIAIRGKGSVKEGARGRRDGKVTESDDEPLHVVITGDDQRSVDAATDMIEQMLVVIDDEKNVHKQQQLRELALLNGTLKEDEYCTVCGEKGHRGFECPKRFTMKKTMEIKCAICGGAHPTRDCTIKPGDPQAADQKVMDSEYMSFMAELDGKKVDKAGNRPPPGAPPPPGGVPAGGPPGPPPPPVAASLPPPVAGVPGSLPPPPPGGVPQPPKPPGAGNFYGNQPQQYRPPGGQNNYYGNQQQQQQGGQQQYYGNQQQQQGRGNYGNQQQPNQQPQQHGQQQQHGGYQGWDYQAYYGNRGGSSGGGGAGGFNWWEK